MSKKEKASQKVSRELLALIENGTFPPGSKLPTEKELTERFNMSRVPIREALSMLRAAGIVSSRQGGGSYVEETTSSDFIQGIRIESDKVESIIHLFELRKILEPEAAFLAAQRRTPEQLEQMKAILNRLENESLSKGSHGKDIDIEFHRSIVNATHNPIMIQTLKTLSNVYKSCLQVTLSPNEKLKRKREAVFREHQQIYNAIEAEEPELARIQSLIHLRNAEKKLSVVLKNFDI
jgi:GntR family transcriptional repressor for pyruvate dehydrogenase complex